MKILPLQNDFRSTEKARPGKSCMFLDVLDSIAEFKHSAAVDAIHEGLAAAKARGVKLIKRSDIRS